MPQEDDSDELLLINDGDEQNPVQVLSAIALDVTRRPPHHALHARPGAAITVITFRSKLSSEAVQPRWNRLTRRHY